ncbi:hypothetical protein EC973_009113, partial [Apophysomyces ossiformis]
MTLGMTMSIQQPLARLLLQPLKSTSLLRIQRVKFPRLGACPDPHACIFPPDVSQFLPGSIFDLRVELHAYDKNTSNPTPAPYKHFKTLDSINVAISSRIWKKLEFDEPGTYEVKVEYGPKQAHTVQYQVVQPKQVQKKAKNVILFISDGTDTGMITAARAIARKHTSGKFHDFLFLFEHFGELIHVITNSVDFLVTDSANSASAYATAHKSSVNALGVYCDSSKDPFDDPKVELITELIRRRQPKESQGASTAAFVSHTRRRSTAAEISDQLSIINGVANWTSSVAPDVWLTGGAEYFKGKESLKNKDYYEEFQKRGYKLVMNKKQTSAGPLDVWFERNLFVNNVIDNKAAPDLSGKDALRSDQPGLQDMTLKVLETLMKRGDKDALLLLTKQLHTFDFPRAWGDLIELDVTVKETVEWLKKNGKYDDTLDPFDQSYIVKHGNDTVENKRNSIGVYDHAGWPGYFDNNNNDGFPDNWSPQISLAAGTSNNPDHFEAWQTSANGPRHPTVKDEDGHSYIGNKNDPA